MKILFTKHALEDKFYELEEHGWKVTKTKVKAIIKNPKWKGTSKHGQETAISLLDQEHILRVIFRRENDTIIVITLHMARRDKYETTLR